MDIKKILLVTAQEALAVIEDPEIFVALKALIVLLTKV